MIDPASLAPHEIGAIKELYRLNFTQGMSRLLYEDWCADIGIDREEAILSYQRIIDSGLGKIITMGLSLDLAAAGVEYIEKHQLAENTLVATQDAFRKLLLMKGAEAHRENGSRGRVGLDAIIIEFGIVDRVGHMNAYYMRDRGWLDFEGRSVRLTEFGLAVAEAVHFGETIESRWRDLLLGASMTAQARGHALEDLLAELATAQRLEVGSRVRSVGEENDLVISKEHQHFIVSCKWEKKRAPNQYLEILRHRLQKRPGTLGVLVSVGGFSGELVKEAESNTSLGLVILIGRGDLEQIFTHKISLRDLLAERHTSLVRFKRAIFES